LTHPERRFARLSVQEAAAQEVVSLARGGLGKQIDLLHAEMRRGQLDSLPDKELQLSYAILFLRI
jgi:hypothetical protein